MIRIVGSNNNKRRRSAESFYARAADKKLALRAIIEISNSDLFLSQSGYAPN